MPWKECHIVEERLRFIARLLDGEKMACLCREFGISRKTGYKMYNRYKDCGINGLTDRSRRPYRHANQLPMQIEKLIVKFKREYAHWGAPKIARSSGGGIPTCNAPPSAPCTPCWIGMAWLNAGSDVATKRRELHSHAPPILTSCGAPITKASSCSPITAIATH